MHEVSKYLPTAAELRDGFLDKYGPLTNMGPMQRLWHRWGYFSPDHHYGTLMTEPVSGQTTWLDVGCGRNIFPGDNPLADRLARQCAFLLGADPDESIHENQQIMERIQSTIDEVRDGAHSRGAPHGQTSLRRETDKV